MPRRELPKPAVVSWSTWKALLIMLATGGSITSLSWLFKMFWEPGRYVGFNSSPPSFPPPDNRGYSFGKWVFTNCFLDSLGLAATAKICALASLVSRSSGCCLCVCFGIVMWNGLLEHLAEPSLELGSEQCFACAVHRGVDTVLAVL